MLYRAQEQERGELMGRFVKCKGWEGQKAEFTVASGFTFKKKMLKGKRKDMFHSSSNRDKIPKIFGGVFF